MLDDEIARRSITLMAPSKTFNIPGLACAFAVIPDARLRRRFTGVMRGIVPHVNMLGLVATEAPTATARTGIACLIDTLRRNRDASKRPLPRCPAFP
jgi:cystathionine beta-lyase